MGRKILLVTTDQQRYDTLACNGGTLSRTPVVDGLAAGGVRFERAHPQSVVCMPSRSTILTGQHPSTHGVWMNGVPLPPDAPSVAEVLRGAGLPRLGGRRRGDQRVILNVVVPANLSDEQREIAERLDETLGDENLAPRHGEQLGAPLDRRAHLAAASRTAPPDELAVIGPGVRELLGL